MMLIFQVLKKSATTRHETLFGFERESNIEVKITTIIYG